MKFFYKIVKFQNDLSKDAMQCVKSCGFSNAFTKHVGYKIWLDCRMMDNFQQTKHIVQFRCH